jgi:hypothetical protein
MRKILLALLILSLLASPAWALKKTLILVPDNEYTQTGWVRLVATGLVYVGGGDYTIINMAEDSVAAEIAAAKASGLYGAVIILVGSDVYLTHPTAYPNHGKGSIAKYCDISQSPIGIPTVVCSPRMLARNASYTEKFYSGVTAADNWARGSLGSGADSLWARLSTGDSILWRKEAALGTVEKRHLLTRVGLTADATSHPEHAYYWTVDAWTKVGVGAASKAAPGTGATIYMWHVHKTTADRDALPSAQADVIYYIPCFGLSRGTAKDAEIKALAAFLTRFGCIKGFPISVFYDDYAFAASTQFWAVTGSTHGLLNGMTKDLYYAASDSLLQYCSDRHIPIMVNTQYAKAGAFGYNSTTQDTAYVVANMAKWYPDPYVRFGWHATDLYTTSAKTATYQIFSTWGSGSVATGGDHTRLIADLRRDRYLLGTSGMLQYMKDSDAFIFNGGNYHGVAGKYKNDTIFQALAKVGVRKFLVETPTAGYYIDGSNFFTMFYPHAKYPLNLDWTGDSTWVNARMVCVNYSGLGIAQADSNYATPATISDSLLIYGAIGTKVIAVGHLYGSFARSVFNNGREQDATGTRTWDAAEAAAWPLYYNFELRGWSPYIHQSGLAISKSGVYYNSGLLWLKHYWNNLRAYNNLAQSGDATIGNVFNPVFLTEADQKVGPKN